MPGVKSSANVNPLWFSARAGDGTTCKAALGAVDGQIKAGEPATGAIVNGSLGFDVTGGLSFRSGTTARWAKGSEHGQ